MPAVARIHAAKQRRGEPAPERLGERPCQDRQGHDRRDLHRRPEAGEERPAVVEEHQDPGDQDQQDEDPAPGAAGPPGGRSPHRGQPDATPRSATRTRCSPERNRPSPSMGNVFSRSAGRHARTRQPRPGAEPILLRLTGQSARSRSCRCAPPPYSSTRRPTRPATSRSPSVSCARLPRDGAELVGASREVEPARRLGDDQLAGAEPLDGPTISAARAWARELGIHLIAGSIAERVEGQEKAFNTSTLIGPDGELEARYRKIHMFDVDVGGVAYRESEHERAGRRGGHRAARRRPRRRDRRA